jgi:hypothetical protein
MVAITALLVPAYHGSVVAQLAALVAFCDPKMTGCSSIRSPRAAGSSAPAPAAGWDRPGLSDDAGCAPAGMTGLSSAGLAAADAGASFASGFTQDPSNAAPYRRSIASQIAAHRMPLGP